MKPDPVPPPLLVWIARAEPCRLLNAVEKPLGSVEMQLKCLFGMALAALLMVGTSELASAGGPPSKRSGRPSFDRLLSAFDADQNGELAQDEVPEPVWHRLSRADVDDSGSVTRREFDAA